MIHARLFFPLLLIVFFLTGCSASPQASRGIIDCRNVDFTQIGPIELNGEWEFYWKQFDSSGSNFRSIAPARFQKLPSPWNRTVVNGEKLPTFGYAAYRLRLIVDSKQVEKLWFSCKEQTSAYTLWADGKKVLFNGTTGTSKESEVPQARLALAEVEISSDTVNLVMTCSNYHLENGGAVLPVRIGSHEKIISLFSWCAAGQFISLGIILILLLFYLLVYTRQPFSRSALYFTLFCLFSAVLVFTDSGDFRIASLLFPHFPFELLYKLFFLSLASVIPLALLFCSEQFPTMLFKRTLPFLNMICAGYAMLVIFTDCAFYTRVFPCFAAAAALYTVVVFHALYTRREDRMKSAVFGIAYTLFCIAGINDSLYNSAVIDSEYITTYGVSALVLAEASILSRLFIQTYDSNRELLRTIAGYSEESEQLRTAQEELIKRLADLTAQRLPRSIPDPLFNDEQRKYQQEIDRLQGEINALQNQISYDLHHSETVNRSDIDPRQSAVETLSAAIALWCLATGKSKADFAEESRIWAVNTDHNGWKRTLTLDKYLDYKKIPSHPKWKKVIHSAEWIIANTPAETDTQGIAEMAEKLKVML